MKSLIHAIVIALAAAPVIAQAMTVIPAPRVVDPNNLGGIGQAIMEFQLQDRDYRVRPRPTKPLEPVYVPGLNENQPGLLFEPDGQGGYQIFDTDGNFRGYFPR